MESLELSSPVTSGTRCWVSFSGKRVHTFIRSSKGPLDAVWEDPLLPGTLVQPISCVFNYGESREQLASLRFTQGTQKCPQSLCPPWLLSWWQLPP